MKPRGSWAPIPDNEVMRLAKRLDENLRKEGVPLSERGTVECTKITVELLRKQKGSCAFSPGNPQYK
jgi:hypothetical protein